jgi:hypothetical protein
MALSMSLKAQDSTKTEANKIVSFHFHYGFMLPAADMALRYGANSNAGGGFSYKTSSNWVFEGDFNYIFGGKIKIEDSLFQDIADDDGNIIDGNGQFAEVYTYERGYYIMAGVCKITPWLRANANSGITFGLGAGFMQHKIRVYNPDNTAVEVCGDYVKGYDYLSNGFAIRQFVGYTMFGEQRIYSFKFGFEIVEAFTQGRRDYLFPMHGPDTAKRLDILYGLKLVWTIPFKRSTGDVYYYF